MAMPLSPIAAAYPESQLDQDEVYPCKGCGEILEEGKAFELAGNRWHIDCFRCNTCHTLLDSDANLLLLGDGSLICNNCTYSCNACGNKIEDLAILTGDQAFCASCFRCRNCKEKIENLRYARTTQGIFCMACHETMISKRRKNRKHKQAAANGLDKKLPELPRPDMALSQVPSDTPDAANKRVEAERNSESDQAKPRSRKDSGRNGAREDSKDTSTLPASTYTASQPSAPRHPGLSAAVYDPANELGGFFVPLVLDPSPAPTSPTTITREQPDSATSNTANAPDSRTASRDFLKNAVQNRPSREFLRESHQHSSRSSSIERKPVASPHIAYQEKGRQTSDHILDQTRKRSQPQVAPSPQPATSTAPSQYPAAQNEFKLQEAPKTKKSGPRRDSKDNNRSPPVVSPSDSSSQAPTPQIDMPILSPSDSDIYSDISTQGRTSSRDRPTQQVERPRRGDSLAASVNRKDVPTHISELTHNRKASSSSQINGGMTISKPIENHSISKSVFDDTPVRQSSSQSNNTETTLLPYTAPRHAPAPPANHRSSESTSTGHSDASGSPLNIPNYFGLELLNEDRRDENHEPGVLRKMSNAVRGHARSVSDRVISSPRSQKWTKSPMNGSVDLGSPTSSLSPEHREEHNMVRGQLRRAQQRIAELEAEKNNLQTIVNGSPDMNQMHTALKEKRSTMAILDTQREMVVRELEVMTEHLKRVKEGNKPLEMNAFKTEVLNDFAGSLKRLKESLTSEVEGLIQKRNDLTDEISNLIQMKDKGFQEYENLSNRNAQLTQHNNELIHNIQESMKTHKQPNGLGLYMTGSSQGKDKSETSSNDLRQIMLDSSTTFSPTDNDQEPAVITTPHVVKMKQTKPNMLRKGGFGKTLRGIKGALVPERADRAGVQTEGVAYNTMQDANAGAPRSAAETRNFRGFFGGSNDKGGARHLKNLQNSSNPNLAAENVSPSQLFGSDLPARCDFEKRTIPCIVSRCVEEVELRGMDVEGIYRKSGGSGQVNQVKAGFEQSYEYDISDPELEIHAVTSCLKQYFRRLPVPLITFDVYDHLLEASRVEDLDKRAARMREAINMLPKAHRNCLEFLIFHLARVTSHEKDNLMTPLNLAVVFAPTIMRPATIEREMMDMQVQRQAVQSLLELNKTIFESAI